MTSQPVPLPLKLSMLALSCAAGLGCALPSMAAAREGSLGAWREYARQGVMPEYSWNAVAPAAIPTVLSTSLSRSGRVVRQAPLQVRLDFAEAPAGYGSKVLSPVNNLLLRDRSLIQSNVVSAGVARDFAGAGRVEVTAIVAHQRYASAGFGTAAWVAQEELAGLRDQPGQERSSGHGVRLGYSAPLSQTFDWGLSLQSKLDMDAFQSYRGVYTDAGDFDLPARVQTQLRWNATPDTALSFGIERVMYSEISAFTSAALPTRFLSLLGDGQSPEFAWRDLTVYSLEGSVIDAQGAQWSLRYTTRQQPSPTSRLLERAMQDDYTDRNFALGYRRMLRGYGELWLAASYAPSRYFLGATPYTRFDVGSGSQMEVEALWSIPF